MAELEKKTEESKRDLTMRGFSSALMDIGLIAVVLLGLLGTLSWMQAVKPMGPEFWALVGLTLIPLTNFAVLFTRVLRPLDHYETTEDVEEEEGEEDEEPAGENEPEKIDL